MSNVAAVGLICVLVSTATMCTASAAANNVDSVWEQTTLLVPDRHMVTSEGITLGLAIGAADKGSPSAHAYITTMCTDLFYGGNGIWTSTYPSFGATDGQTKYAIGNEGTTYNTVDAAVNKQGYVYIGILPTRAGGGRFDWVNILRGSWTRGCDKKYVHYYVGFDYKPEGVSVAVVRDGSHLNAHGDGKTGYYYTKLATAEMVYEGVLTVSYMSSVVLDAYGQKTTILRTAGDGDVVNLSPKIEGEIVDYVRIWSGGSIVNNGDSVHTSPGASIEIEVAKLPRPGTVRGTITTQVSVK